MGYSCLGKQTLDNNKYITVDGVISLQVVDATMQVCVKECTQPFVIQAPEGV